MTLLVSFAGPVSWRCDNACPLPWQLRGRERGVSGTTLLVDVAGPVPAGLPGALHDIELEVSVARFDASTQTTQRSYALHMSGKQYAIAGGNLLIHRDASGLAASAIAPHPARWRTRAFWWLVFLLMRSSLGRSLLLRRYRT